MINSGIISLKISKFYLILCIIFCIKYNSGGSGTVTAGLPQGETKGFYFEYKYVDIHTHTCNNNEKR